MKKRIVYLKCKACNVWYRANPKDYKIKFKNTMADETPVETPVEETPAESVEEATEEVAE